MFFDVTAGERARRIRQHTDRPEFVADPTDPRAEELSSEQPEALGAPERVLDPTDPRYGDAVA